ncbi:MAG: hypothetical protein QM796_08340 [Chthoniobacteraceae bacterium]
MKKYAIITALLFGAGLLKAQQPAAQATPKPELPPGPLLNHAPDMAQWTISFRGAATVPDDKSAKPGEKPAFDTSDYRVAVVKTKPIYHILMAMGNGEKMDKWCVGEVQVTKQPNAAYPILSTPSNKDAYYMDFSKQDFTGFGWISASNYQGIKKVAGVDCMIFRDKIKSPVGGAADMVDAQAVIDVKSRLPLYLQVGEGLSTYQYGNTPTALQTPPTEVTALIQQWRKRIQQASMLPPS